MNKFNLSDNYSVMIEKPLCDYDRKTIMNLYLPIVGKKTIDLLQSLYDSVLINEHESLVYSLEKIIKKSELSLDKVVDSLNKLEAIGLLKTYYLDKMYVFYLNKIITPSEFFKDEALSQALISVITKEEYEKLVLEFLIRRIDITKFDNISKRFDEVFEIEEEINHFSVDALVVDSSEGIRIKNNNFNYRHFKMFVSTLNILSEEKLDDYELESFVNRYSFLYKLTEEEMKDALVVSLNTNTSIDYDLFVKNIKKIYNNKNKKNQKVVPKKEINTNDSKAKLLESITPQDIVVNKYNMPMVASEIATMDELLKTTGISVGFLNVVLLYVLEKRNGEIPTYNYFNKIIQTWKRAGVKTAEDALNYLDSLNNPKPKGYNKQKVTKEVPNWYNDYKEETKKELDQKIVTKEENIEDLEQFFKVEEK